MPSSMVSPVDTNAINRTTSLVVGLEKDLLLMAATSKQHIPLMRFEDATAFATRTYYTNTSGIDQ